MPNNPPERRLRVGDRLARVSVANDSFFTEEQWPIFADPPAHSFPFEVKSHARGLAAALPVEV
jgi:hypothetical protein